MGSAHSSVLTRPLLPPGLLTANAAHHYLSSDAAGSSDDLLFGSASSQQYPIIFYITFRAAPELHDLSAANQLWVNYWVCPLWGAAHSSVLTRPLMLLGLLTADAPHHLMLLGLLLTMPSHCARPSLPHQNQIVLGLPKLLLPPHPSPSLCYSLQHMKCRCNVMGPGWVGIKPNPLCKPELGVGTIAIRRSEPLNP